MTVPGIGLGGALGGGLVDAVDQYKKSSQYYRDDAEQQKRIGWEDQSFQDQMDADAAEHGMDADEFKKLAFTLSPNNPIHQIMDSHDKARQSVDPNYQPPQPQGQPGQLPPLPPDQTTPQQALAKPAQNINDLKRRVTMAPKLAMGGGGQNFTPILPADMGQLSNGSPLATSLTDTSQYQDSIGMGNLASMSGGEGNYLDRSAARSLMRDAFDKRREGAVNAPKGLQVQPSAPGATPRLAPLPGQPKAVMPPRAAAPGKGDSLASQDYSKVSQGASSFDLDNLDTQLGDVARQYDDVTDEMRQRAQTIAAVDNPRARGLLYTKMLNQYKPQLKAMEDQAKQLNANYQIGLQRTAFQHVFQSALAGDDDSVKAYMSKLDLPPSMVQGYQGIKPEVDKDGNQTGQAISFLDREGNEHRIDLGLFHAAFDPDSTPQEQQKAISELSKNQVTIEKNMVTADARAKEAEAKRQSALDKAQADREFKERMAGIEHDYKLAEIGARGNGGTEEDTENKLDANGKVISKKVTKKKLPSSGAQPPTAQPANPGSKDLNQQL